MRLVVAFVLAGFAVAICGGCQNALHDENQKLFQQNRELQSKIRELETRPAPASGTDALVQQLRDQLAARDAEISKLKETPTTPPQPTGLEGMEVSVDPSAGTLTVNLPSDVLFASGEATLKPTAQATLKQVVDALNKQYAGKKIRVEGHTDSDKINVTRDKWKDNLDLSLERAANVTRFLIDHKVDAKRIATVGYGEQRPRGAAKDKNRRVEIVVVLK